MIRVLSFAAAVVLLAVSASAASAAKALGGPHANGCTLTAPLGST